MINLAFRVHLAPCAIDVDQWTGSTARQRRHQTATKAKRCKAHDARIRDLAEIFAAQLALQRNADVSTVSMSNMVVTYARPCRSPSAAP